MLRAMTKYLGMLAAAATFGFIGLAAAQTQLGNGNFPITGPTPWAIIPVVSTTAEAGHVIKPAPGLLYSVTVTNATSTAGFVLVTNSTTAATTGTVAPLACVPLPASGVANINFAPRPAGYFSTGISVVLSSNASCFSVTTGTITGFISALAE